MENISPVYARFVLRELNNRGVAASEVGLKTPSDGVLGQHFAV